MARCLEEKKIVLLCPKIKLSTGILLKKIPQWLISKSWREKWLKTGNKRRSLIVIIMAITKEATKLCYKRWKLGRALKLVEKY